MVSEFLQFVDRTSRFVFGRSRAEISVWRPAYLDLLIITVKEPGSSVSIVSDCGLDDQAIGVRLSAGAKDFSSNLCVQSGSGAHPAPCTMGTGGPFPGAMRDRGVTLTTHPNLVPRSRMNRSYTSSTLKRHHGV
jgi:hypothetical protein